MRYPRTAFEIVWQSPWVRAFVYALLVVLLAWLLWNFRRGYAFALQVGIFGFLIAYILNPLANLLQRLRFHRVLAVVIIYILLINLLVLGSILVTQVLGELGRFINLIPTSFDSIGGFIERLSVWLSGLLERLPGVLSDRFGVEAGGDAVALEIRTRLTDLLAGFIESVSRLLEGLVLAGPGRLISGATNILSTTFQVFLIFLASAYFLYDFPKVTATFRRTVPLRWRGLYDDLTDKADRAVGGYLRGQLLITLTLGVFIFIGLSLLQIPLALAISFLAAIFNLVPYLGPIIGVTPAVLLGFTVSPLTALLAVVVFIVANQLESNVLSPLILSRSTNIHPVTVLLAILAGVGLFGLAGALLAVPTVAFVKILLEDYLFTRPPYRERVTVPAEEPGPPPQQPL